MYPFWLTYCSIDFSYSVSINLPCFYIGTVLYSHCCLVYQMWHILVSSYNLVVVHNLLLGSSKHRILTVLICWEHSLFGSYSSCIKLAYLYTTAKAITWMQYGYFTIFDVVNMLWNDEQDLENPCLFFLSACLKLTVIIGWNDIFWNKEPE